MCLCIYFHRDLSTVVSNGGVQLQNYTDLFIMHYLE